MRKGGVMMAVTINYGVVRLNSIQDISGFFLGENVQQGMTSPNKINTTSAISGMGDVIGSQLNMVNDIDIVDLLANRVNNQSSPAPGIVKCC
jgi:hypothetical protein